MGLPTFDGNDISGLACLHLAIKRKLKGSIENMEGLFLELMCVAGVFLSWKKEDDLLAIFAVDTVDDRTSPALELVNSIVVRQLQREFIAKRYFAVL